MPAPGTEPGVTFTWADLVMFNDAGQVAFRGGLTGEGVDGSNDRGRWLGGPGALELVTRAGDPAPGFPPDVILAGAGGGLTSTNNHGDANELTLLEGSGITEDNDMILYAGPPGELHVVAREGDLAPEAGEDVEIAGIGNSFLDSPREVFYQVKYGGPSIDDSNRWAMYLGPYDAPRLSLRDGDAAPHFPPETVLWAVGAMTSLAAMNDVGDIVGPSEIVGPDVGENDKAVLWLRHHALQQWVPLLRGNATVGGRVVFAPSYNELGLCYQYATGGSDGQRQSLNDNRQLAVKLEFTDGSQGVYLIEPPLFGDADADGDVDLADWTSVHLCCAGPGAGLGEGCELFDFDWNGDVDLADFAVFQRLFGGGL